MTSTFTKLFRSIVSSSIWSEDAEISKVWVTLMALADQHGEVEGTVPWLARTSYVSLGVCEKALVLFTSPDPHSRTHANEGRRLEAIEGGWILLNYEKYRAMANDDHRKEQARIRQQRKRDRDRA